MSAAPEINKPLTASRLARFQELGLVLVIAVLFGALTVYGWRHAVPESGQTNTFFNMENLVSGIATPMSYYAIMAVGLTVVIISGGIDISVASIMALSALVTAYTLIQANQPAEYFAGAKATWLDRNLFRHLAGHGMWLYTVISLALPLAVGLVCGLINGVIVVALRMHPFIVTLGTLAIFRCACNTLEFGTKTLPVPERFLTEGSVIALLQKQSFAREVDGYIEGGVQMWPLVFMLIAGALGFVYLSLTSWGRETFAVGGNEEAARFSGIRVELVKIRVYAISGLCAGLAGLVTLGRFGTVSTNTATGYELTVVAAAVVGGAALTGGRGTALGALLGTLILNLIENAINILQLNQELKLGVVGASIIFAVALDTFSQAVRARLRRRRAH